MAGQHLKKLPSPIFIDLGACASVMPTEWCSHIQIQKRPASEAGEFIRAANGIKLQNEGERFVTMMIREGVMRDMKFTACPVTKALGSVSQIHKTGHKVIFNPPWEPEGSYIERLETGDKLWMEERDGLYALNTRVAPSNRQTLNYLNGVQSFHGPVLP